MLSQWQPAVPFVTKKLASWQIPVFASFGVLYRLAISMIDCVWGISNRFRLLKHIVISHIISSWPNLFHFWEEFANNQSSYHKTSMVRSHIDIDSIYIRWQHPHPHCHVNHRCPPVCLSLGPSEKQIMAGVGYYDIRTVAPETGI